MLRFVRVSEANHGIHNEGKKKLNRTLSTKYTQQQL